MDSPIERLAGAMDLKKDSLVQIPLIDGSLIGIAVDSNIVLEILKTQIDLDGKRQNANKN